MPIQQCTLPDGGKGWKWGASGKCYAARADAERQAAAIHASGYGEDNDAIALDAASVRHVDDYGHMSVERSNISKAMVCPYRGSEIPGWQQLRLDPDRIYRLLRDPDELAQAAPSFAGKPLMLAHRPVTADNHAPGLVCGAIGSDVLFEPPYLTAPLTVWTQQAIDLIESDEQKELSSAYGYDPDMTPGTFQGARYDGVMRNLRGNHVTLVETGRAGPDVVVGDSAMVLAADAEQPRDNQGQFSSTPGGKTEHSHASSNPGSPGFKKARANAHEHAAQLRAKGHENVKVTRRTGNVTLPGKGVGVSATYTTHHGAPPSQAHDGFIKETGMATKPQKLSLMAATAHGALLPYFLPKLAQDQTIDLRKALAGTTAKNWKAQKPVIVARLTKAVQGKLAQDADLSDLLQLFDRLDGSVQENDEDPTDIGIDQPKETAGDPAGDPAAGPANGGGNGEEADEGDAGLPPNILHVKKLLKDLIRPEDLAVVMHLLMPPSEAHAPEGGEGGTPNADADPTDKENPLVKPNPEDDKNKPPAFDKGAMDAQIAKARKDAVAETVAHMNAIREAERIVEPLIGKLAIAQDSAAAIYKLALDEEPDIDLEGVPPSAYPAMVKMLVAQKAKGPPIGGGPTHLAMDEAGTKRYLERFPNANRLRQRH